jgi:hypothetical protein
MTLKFTTELEEELYEALVGVQEQLTILHEYATYIRSELLKKNPKITYIDLDSLDDARIARSIAADVLTKARGEN